MKNNYCPECGAKLLRGDAFCSDCGTKIIQEEKVVEIIINHCTKCAYTSNEDEMFCPECGAQMSQKLDAISISDDMPLPTKGTQKIEYSHQSNKESLKTNTKPIHNPKRQKSSKNPVAIAMQPKGKKKGGFLRMVGKLVLGIVVLFIVGSVILYNLDDSEWDDNGRVDKQSDLPTEYADEEPANIPAQKTEARPNANESKSVKQFAIQVEQIFQNADTSALKQILTKTSLATYDGVFSSIEPYMREYSSAFKNRKIEVKTNMYSLYSFKDKNGKIFTVEFAQVDDGVWKLVRF